MTNSASILGINILPEEKDRFIAFRKQNSGLEFECVEFHASVGMALGGLSLSLPEVNLGVDLVVLGLNYNRALHRVQASVPLGLTDQMAAIERWFPSADIFVVSNVPVWAREDHGDQFGGFNRFIDIASYSHVARFLAMIVGDPLINPEK